MLAKTVKQNGSDWDKHLPYVLYRYRNQSAGVYKGISLNLSTVRTGLQATNRPSSSYLHSHFVI